jgi:hypothetical protein
MLRHQAQGDHGLQMRIAVQSATYRMETQEQVDITHWDGHEIP